MNVREATLDDLAGLIAIGKENADAAGLTRHGVSLEGMGRAFIAALECDIAVVFVAEEDDQIVGVLMLVVHPQPQDIEKREAIETAFWVAPNKRNSGSGSALVDAATDWCAAQKITRIYMHSLLEDPDYRRTIGMLSRRGFRPLETRLIREVP